MVLVIAYAFARFSVLYPNNVLTLHEKNMAYFFRSFIMVPFFQLFGELFIEKPESVNGERLDCLFIYGNNHSIYGSVNTIYGRKTP